VVPLFSRTFDSVIGNPPWLVFREMDEGMKDVANFVLIERDLRPHPKVKSHFDLAIAFTVASASYLKPSARLGFVLPRSLVAGLQHLPFLEAVTKSGFPLRLDEVDDLQGVSPPPFPHGVPCVAAFFRSSET
jgi:Eco57I restriction-modification methylase